MTSKKDRRPRTMQEEQPEAPEGECLNFEAYHYISGTDCDGIWQAWDEWCSGLDMQDYEAICMPVIESLSNPVDADIDIVDTTLDAVRPEGECLNWDSFYYGVENPYCT